MVSARLTDREGKTATVVRLHPTECPVTVAVLFREEALRLLIYEGLLADYYHPRRTARDAPAYDRRAFTWLRVWSHNGYYDFAYSHRTS